MEHLMAVMALALAFSFSIWAGVASERVIVEGNRMWAAVWFVLTALVIGLSVLAGGILL